MGKLKPQTKALALSTAILTLAVATFVVPPGFGQSPTTTTTATATTTCPTTTTTTPMGTTSPMPTTTTYADSQQTTTTTPCPSPGRNTTMPFFPTADDTGGSPVGEGGGAPSLILPLAALAVVGVAIVMERRKR